MKKILVLGLILTLSSTMSSANCFTKKEFYIGVARNSFSLKGGDITVTTGASAVVLSESPNAGTAIGFSGGIILNRMKRINFSYFSGKEENSSIFTVTSASLSVNHSFNNYGEHQGWFLGGGLSNIKLRNDTTGSISSGTSSGTGLLLRGGYEHRFSNKFYLDLGVNMHMVGVEHKIKYGSNLRTSNKVEVTNTYLSLNYLF